MAWPELRVAVEYQGDQHRTDLVRWRRDQERWALLAAAGWLVIPATWADVHRRSATFAARVRAALTARA
jgi:very-short-patch-repair endonuclease